MRSLNIAFILPSFPSTTETFIVNQIVDLIDRGHKVKIFALKQNKNTIVHQKILDYDLLEKTSFREDPSYTKIGRIKYFFKYLFLGRKHIDYLKVLRVFNYFKYGKKAFNLRVFMRYRFLLEQEEFDFFYAHFGQMGAYIAELKNIGFFQNTPLVTSFHGYDIKPNNIPLDKNRYHHLFREAAYIFVNSLYTKRLVEELCVGDRIKILPVGLDTNKFTKNTNLKSNTFYLLFVGRLIPLKGPILSIKILEILINRGYKEIKLSIVGEGELFSELNDYIFKNGIQNWVKLEGNLPQEEIIKLMSKSDVFLLPGIYDVTGRAETQGLVIQEAQAMEIPVLVSDVGGMKYGVSHGETGFVIEENDLEGFADKIELLMKDKFLRERMGRNGRKFVVKNFDSKVLGEQLQNWLFKLLKEKK